MVEIIYVSLLIIFIPLILYSVILRIAPNKNKWDFVFIHLGNVGASLLVIDLGSMLLNDGTRHIITFSVGIGFLVFSVFMAIKSALIARKHNKAINRN